MNGYGYGPGTQVPSSRYYERKQERKSDDWRNIMNMILAAMQMKERRGERKWEKEQELSKQEWARKLQQKRVDLEQRRTKEYERRGQEEKPVTLPEFIQKADLIAKAKGITRGQAVVELFKKPTMQEDIDKALKIHRGKREIDIQYPKPPTQQDWSPQQLHQVDKSFLTKMISGIDSAITRYSATALTPAALRTMPEVKRLDNARKALAKYLMKTKLTDKDKQDILQYADIQAIITDTIGQEVQPIPEEKQQEGDFFSPEEIE